MKHLLIKNLKAQKMKKKLIVIVLIMMVQHTIYSQQKEFLPKPSAKPSKGQLEQINRKYGMFIHFGINTFHNEEWTDGSKPADSYVPETIDAEQWVLTAKNAGMKYVILVSKHHEGFSMWDSKYTTYDVASSPNKTNVVEAVAKACKKHNIQLGLYYSLWDRKENADVKDASKDKDYNTYMINQLNELLDIAGKHVKIAEFWFDGSWTKPSDRWPLQDIYNTIKKKQPLCQVGINWTIGLPENPDKQGVLPQDQKNGYPIRFFPSDFRLGDPYLPVNPDPKHFSFKGKSYYMPWESTVCMSEKWFYHTDDKTYKTIDQLEALYKQATAQDNILIINCPPNRKGQMREQDATLLVELRKKLNLK
jgi:alpha-L-fucosidase